MSDDHTLSSAATMPSPLIAGRPAAPLAGVVAVPGDKSISHRALMFGALAIGRTEITGLLEGEDVLATAAALRAMGAEITRAEDGRWLVDGVGVGGLAEPDDVIDLGNSGTSARLLLGILASHPFTAFVTGDASLRRRPMNRVITPLSAGPRRPIWRCRKPAGGHLFLTGRAGCGNAAQPRHGIIDPIEKATGAAIGQTRMGHQAHLPELRGALLRFDA